MLVYMVVKENPCCRTVRALCSDRVLFFVGVLEGSISVPLGRWYKMEAERYKVMRCGLG